jgi:MoaA/NifB/PqqE/SkfB family radical SAM enzyme
MDPDLFRKLMDETPGRPLVSFTGGEPLLHPGVVDFVAMAHAKGCPTGLTTNGWFLAGKAKALRDAGLDMLTVSVDGPAATHNRIRGAHSFERLAAGLAEFRDMPDRPVIFVSMAISDLNCHELVEMYELAVAWGVDGLNFNHLWMQTDAVVDAFNSQFPFLFRADRVAWSVNPAEVDVRQLVDSLAAIEHRCWRAPLVVTETPFLSRHEIPRWYRQPALLVKWRTTRCAWIRLRVWPDGSVRACRELSVGSIAKDHVMDVWNGPAMRAFRKLLTAHGTVPICARCCYLPHR